MTKRPIVPGDLFARTQTIAGLRALADFLEANPAVPVPEFGWTFTVFGRRSTPDACQRAEVDRIAGLLGVTVLDETGQGGHYRASRRFGRITYESIHIPARSIAEHKAETSYRTNIRLDDEAA